MCGVTGDLPVSNISGCGNRTGSLEIALQMRWVGCVVGVDFGVLSTPEHVCILSPSHDYNQ